MRTIKGFKVRGTSYPVSVKWENVEEKPALSELLGLPEIEFKVAIDNNDYQEGELPVCTIDFDEESTNSKPIYNILFKNIVGLKGDIGESTSLFVKYANTNPSIDETAIITNNFTANSKYVGVYVGKTAPEGTNQYTWCKFIGDSTFELWKQLDGNSEKTITEFFSEVIKNWNYKYVNYYSSASNTIGSFCTNLASDFPASEANDNVVYLMPDDDDNPEATRMYILAKDGNTIKFLYIGNMNVDASSFLQKSDIDDTHFDNPASGALVKAEDVMMFKQQLRGTTLEEIKIEIEPFNITDGAITPDNTIIPAIGWKYAEFSCAGYDNIRFLGMLAKSQLVNVGWCFLNNNNVVIGGNFYNYDTTLTNSEPKEYLIKVPNGAVTFKTNVQITSISGFENMFYCYFQKGSSLMDEIENVHESVMLTELVVASNTGSIKTDGTVGPTATSFRYTSPILLSKGKTVFVKTGAFGFSVIAQTDENHSFYRMLVQGEGSGINSYKYTATEDMYVAACVYIGNTNEIRIESNNNIIDEINSIKADLAMYDNIIPDINGYYIFTDGTVQQSASFGMTSPILLKAGEKVEVYCRATGLAIISITNEQGTLHNPVVLADNQIHFRTYEYIATVDTYIEVSVPIVSKHYIHWYHGEVIQEKLDKIEDKLSTVLVTEDVKMELQVCWFATWTPYTSIPYNSEQWATSFAQVDFIKISDGDVLTFSNQFDSQIEKLYICLFDKNQNFIRKDEITTETYTVSGGCVYARFCITRNSGQYSSRKRILSFTRTGYGTHEFSKWIVPINENIYRTYRCTVPVEMPPLNEFSDNTNTYNATTYQPPVFTDGTVCFRKDLYDIKSPMKVCLFFTGTGSYVFNSGHTPPLYEYQLTKLLMDSGYAVIVSSSQTNIGVNKSSEDWASQTDCNWSDAITMACNKAVLEYFTKLFNFDKSIYVAAKSAGGMMAAVISQIGTFSIKAVGLIAPSLDYFTYYKILDGTKDCSSSIRRLGVTNAEIHGIGYGGITSSEMEMLINNLDKIIPWNPLFHNTANLDFENYIRQVTPTAMLSYETNAELVSIINSASKNVTVPMKIWHAVDDKNVPISTSRFFAKMVRNGGGICFLREIPANCGKHSINHNTATGVGLVDYVTKYGELIINTTITNAELVNWLNQW